MAVLFLHSDSKPFILLSRHNTELSQRHLSARKEPGQGARRSSSVLNCSLLFYKTIFTSTQYSDQLRISLFICFVGSRKLLPSKSPTDPQMKASQISGCHREGGEILSGILIKGRSIIKETEITHWVSEKAEYLQCMTVG